MAAMIWVHVDSHHHYVFAVYPLTSGTGRTGSKRAGCEWIKQRATGRRKSESVPEGGSSEKGERGGQEGNEGSWELSTQGLGDGKHHP